MLRVLIVVIATTLLSACNSYSKVAFGIEKGHEGYKFSKSGSTKQDKKNDLRSCARIVGKELGNNTARADQETKIVKCMESKRWQALQFVVLKH
ncbi:MAG: hypothetical protein AAF431_12380 [Pseudomonadota bacterium]